MLSGIRNLDWKCVKNASQRLQTLFIKAEFSAGFHCILCKIHWSKPYTAFVKIVEGQLIYSFGIDCLWHFSCKKLSNCWSKGGKPKGETPLCAPSHHVAHTRRRGTPWPARRDQPVPVGPCAVGPNCAKPTLPDLSLAATRRALTRWTAAPPHTAGSTATARLCPHPAVPLPMPCEPMPSHSSDRSVTHRLHLCPAIKPPCRLCSRVILSFRGRHCRRRRAPLSARSLSQPTVSAPPLGHREATRATRWPAPPLSSLEFECPRPRNHRSAAAARRWHFRPSHHRQSREGELNRASVPYVYLCRAHIVGSEPAPPPRLPLWGILVFEGLVVRFEAWLWSSNLSRGLRAKWFFTFVVFQLKLVNSI
jgi:hypothetical protein